MILRMSFLNQLKMLSDLIFISICYFLLLYISLETFDFKLISCLVIPYVLISIFPVLFLHFNYLNQGKSIIFEINQNKILKKMGNNILKYHIEEINEIVFFMNGAKNTGYGALPFKKYHYAKINFLDGSCFIITSLYSSKIDKILEENFKDVKMTTEKVFYPMIRSVEN